jgi:dihydroorotase
MAPRSKPSFPHSARQFGRALIMPNLRPPVTTAAQAVAYRDRILAAVPEGRPSSR